MTRVRSILALAAVAVALTSCDFGPSGPGVLDATVSGPQALGAALVEITGTGVNGFVGQGDSQVFGAQTSTTSGTHRVLIVSASGGTLRFGIDVDDVSAPPPVATVLRTASPANIVILATGVVVEIDEP